MSKNVYKNEPILFSIALVLSLLFWFYFIKISYKEMVVIVPVLCVAYLFIQSALICYIKGNGVLIRQDQFPDLKERVRSCAIKSGLPAVPRVYILNGNGVLNAFATKFLRTDYIVLLSDVLDALEDRPEAINFYIGHEMGHIARKHVYWQFVLAPALILPLLGAAYSRAREYTADLYGAMCTATPDAALRGLTVLAVGGKRYKTLNMEPYLAQSQNTSGFWMSFHELIAGYPWLVKRCLRLSPNFADNRMPRRNIFAYIPAIFVPRLNVLSVVLIYVLIVSSIANVAGNELTGGIRQKIWGTSAAKQSAGPALSDADKAALKNSAGSPTGEAGTEPQTEAHPKAGSIYQFGDGQQYQYLGGEESDQKNWKLVR